MPGPLTGPLIVAGSSLLGSGVNAYAQGKMNRKTREWNERMYGMQRRDALADWAMQNDYNSPMSQMQRFRDAGLNPALIYGQTNEGAVVRSTNMDSWRPQAPQVDIGGAFAGGLQAFYDVQMKEAQIDNLKVANSVAKEDMLLRQAQVLATLAGKDKTKQDIAWNQFQMKLAEDLRPVTLESASEGLRKMKGETEFILDNNERAAASNAQSLREGAERILNLRSQRANNEVERDHIRQQIENLKKDERLKELDIELKRNGIQPTDPIYFRILGRILGAKDVWKNLLPGMLR